MPRRKRTAQRAKRPPAQVGSPLSLKELADHVGLSPTTVSLVLNQSPVANSIPTATKRRIFAAAQKFSYRPNFVARSLRTQRSYTVGVVVPEVSEGYESTVLSGIEDRLIEEGYFYFVASHRHRPDLIENCPRMLLERSVEGLIAVDTPCRDHLAIPIVAVSAHDQVEGVTIIELDHRRAASLALEHLFQLGHRRIAVIKGQAFSSDTEVRWRSIADAAGRLGLEVNPQLVAQLSEYDPSPEVGYHATQRLLAAHEPFTGLFAFNDVSAIGAVRALREAGLRVPEDVSVIGFDDIKSAAFQNPSLTTVRQPLRQMGELAAKTLLGRIGKPNHSDYPRRLIVEPELVVRESTCQAPGSG
jgi:LacI family transcriptional regulator, galactose operon repressor